MPSIAIDDFWMMFFKQDPHGLAQVYGRFSTLDTSATSLIVGVSQISGVKGFAEIDDSCRQVANGICCRLSCSVCCEIAGFRVVDVDFSRCTKFWESIETLKFTGDIWWYKKIDVPLQALTEKHQLNQSCTDGSRLSVDLTRVILPKKNTWLETTWSSHFLTSYCMFRMMITTTSDMFFFVTAFNHSLDFCGPIFRSPPNRSNPGRQRPNLGVPMRVWFFHGHWGDRLWCWDQRAGGSPISPKKKGWNMFGHPESLWNCEVNSNIYTFFFVTFFHLLKNRWVFKISVPTFFCCWTLHLLIVSDTSRGKSSVPKELHQ